MAYLQEEDDLVEMDYEEKMEWFKEEFRISFGIPLRDTFFTAKDRQLYRSLINKMAETIFRKFTNHLFTI